MADDHRSVSRYRQNIVADTSQLVHNINGKRPEYAQGYRKSDVYEQYARPKSRRSPVPMSGVEIIERPRTSRGRRIHHEQDTSAAEIERPGTRRGHRSNTPVEGTERPLTRHGRRGSVPERPITRHGRQSQQDFHEGSKTRTKSDSDYINQEYREGSTSRIDILTLDGGPTPTPPPKPNVRMRPKSAKGRVRPKPAPRPSIDRDETPTPALMSPSPTNVMSPTPQPQVITPMCHATDSRPSSSLNRFNPLPSIGRKPSIEANISEINYPRPSPRDFTAKEDVEKKPVPKPRTKHQATDVKASNTNKQHNRNDPVIVSVEPEPEFQPLTRKVVLPAEPNQSEEHFILAVKLPSGERPQRRFRPSDTLETVIHFAELSSQLDFEGCELVCDVPSRLVFSDLKVTIKNSGLKNRTVLHVQIPDEEE